MNNYIRSINLLVLLISALHVVNCAQAQDYTADNRLYKTIDWDAFLNKLSKNPDLIFFDIRTPGERSDTSRYAASNQGKIKGAIETDYFEFEKYYPLYQKHKGDTIYLYCSHSMRSRRLAKQLADSSFTKVVNINGGMSYLNLKGANRFELKSRFYETTVRYKLLSALDLSAKLAEKDVQIIDVRSDSVYMGISKSVADNRIGFIKGIIHIPVEKLNDRSFARFNKSKPIVLLDNWCDESPSVANRLIDAGFKDVSVLHFGLDDLIDRVPSTERAYLKTKFPMLLAEELISLQAKQPVVIIDIRPQTEFTNTDTVGWKNIGKIKGAINLPLSEFKMEAFARFQNKTILIYDGRMNDELYLAAQKLSDYGLHHVNLLAGGLYMIHWRIANERLNKLNILIED